MLSGDLLKRIRLARGLSQKEVAAASGINIRILQGLERFEIETNQRYVDAYVKGVYSVPAKTPTPHGRPKKNKNKETRE